MDDRGLTLAAMEERSWTVILLEPGTKRPQAGRTWDECATQSVAAARRHLSRGGGIGLDVAASGIAVLDFDVPGALAEMAATLGLMVPPAATSPSGGWHVYVAALENLPAAIEWNGARVGEVIRGPRQHVCLPPSPYPGSPKRGVPAGGAYTWTGAIDPRLPPYELPSAWHSYLVNQLPDFIKPTDDNGQPTWEDPWTGPTPEELIAAAMRQPGARHRAGKVKFQCPECAHEGHDRHRDNAVVFDNGRWACAYAPGDADHRQAIGKALGFSRWTDADRRMADDLIDEALLKSITGGHSIE